MEHLHCWETDQDIILMQWYNKKISDNAPKDQILQDVNEYTVNITKSSQTTFEKILMV
jgi:hypothetical protein